MEPAINPAKVKPIRLFRPDATTTERTAIYDALKEIRYHSGNALTRIQDPHVQVAAGHSRGRDILDRMEIVLRAGEVNSRNQYQLNARSIINQLQVNRDHETGVEGKEDYYSLVILPHDIYADDMNFIFGIGRKDFGTVISTARLPNNIENRYSLLKHLVAHELGHVFGTPSRERSGDVEEYLGRHCTNTCTMRSGNSLGDLERITKEAEANGTYCDSCSQDLYDYFRI